MTREEGFLVFGKPEIGQEEIDEVVATLRSGWLGTGERVKRFEEDFRRYNGSSHAVAVNSCTAGLHLSLIAAGVGPGDEVVTTPLTFCATVNAIIHTGATPVLADVDPVTMNIDPEKLRQAVTPRTKAVVPVHFAGRVCDMAAVMEIAGDRGLKVVEDCAHAVETEYHGKKAGTFGDYGCFSFYATKNVVTGEGGMVVAKDEEAAERLRALSLHGMSKDAWARFGSTGYKHYQVVEPGFKYNMMDLQAAIGIHQLARVEKNHARRERVWRLYQQELSDLPLTLPASPSPGTRHAYHLYNVLVDEEAGVGRDAFLAGMTKNGIGVGVHYLSIPEHPYYRQAYGWTPEMFPQAMRIGRRTVSLPLGPGMEPHAPRVVDAARTVLAGPKGGS